MIKEEYIQTFINFIKEETIGKINPEKISKKEELENLIKIYKYTHPSQNKEIQVPFYIYAKYFLKLLLDNKNILEKICKLANEELKKIKGLIYILYLSLKRNQLKNYSENIYGLGLFSKEKIKKIEEKLDNNNQNITGDKNKKLNKPIIKFNSFQCFTCKEKKIKLIMTHVLLILKVKQK